MIKSIIRKPGPIQLPTGNTGNTGNTGSTGTCQTWPCPDVLVPGYQNNGTDGGTAIPATGTTGSAVPTTPAAQVGTGMDVEKTTSVWAEIGTLIVPGIALAVLALVLYWSSQKS